MKPVRREGQLLPEALDFTGLCVGVGVELVDEREPEVLGLRRASWLRRLLLPALVVSPARVTPLDLRPEACSESLLLGKHDPELLRQYGRQFGTGHEAFLDENLTDSLARLLLIGQSLCQLLRRDQALLDEELSKQLLRDACRFHELS
jgi:hypothetical protein